MAQFCPRKIFQYNIRKIQHQLPLQTRVAAITGLVMSKVPTRASNRDGQISVQIAIPLIREEEFNEFNEL
jgi:hypothetical protein